MKDRLIKKLGGFTKAEVDELADWMAEILEMKEKTRKPTKAEVADYVWELSEGPWKSDKENLLNNCIKHLFKGATLKDR